MKSTFLFFSFVVCLIIAVPSAEAQNQGQDQGNQQGQQGNQGRYEPYREPYTPYVKPKEPRVIDSRSRVGLDGGEVGGTAAGGRFTPMGRNIGGGGNGPIHQGPMGPSRFSGGPNNGQFVNRSGGNRNNGGLQVSINNGTRTITVNEATRKVKIVDNPNTGIYMEVTKNYGPRQMNQLKSKMPELTEYIEMFPSEVGSDQVSLSIELTSKYNARTPQELADQDKGVYNIYQRYTREANNQGTANQNANNRSYPGFAPARSNKQRNLPTASVGGGGRATNKN